MHEPSSDAHDAVRNVLLAQQGSPSHALYRNVLDALPTPVFVKDEDHRWILLNRAFSELVGLPPDELYGRSDHDIFPKHEADVFWAKDEEVFKGQTVANEESMTTPEGELRWLLTTKSPCVLGERTLLVGVIQDISHRRLYEESLQRQWAEALAASQTKSLFLTKMSHELRTPLNAIIGYSEFHLEDPEQVTPEQLERDSRRILTSAHHLLELISVDEVRASISTAANAVRASLINEILDLAQIESGRVEVNPETVEVAQLLVEMNNILAPLAAQRGNTFRAEMGAGVPPTIDVDRRKLRQILINLLANANKHTLRGHVVLELEPVELQGQPGVAFHVRDSGEGIPRSMLECIFEPFVQAHSSPDDNKRGVGLGLAITRRLTQLLRGELAVKSEMGSGSTFSVLLPRLWAPSVQP